MSKAQMKGAWKVLEPEHRRPARAFGKSWASPPSDAQLSASENPARKVIEFRLEAPSARSVKLAADFTEWENAAINLANKGNGTWGIRLPLSPGRYAYRFLVDGDWHDDPRCAERIPNPFGTSNSVIEVV
jgi:1,4-alpha-glucan branching enzyme